MAAFAVIFATCRWLGLEPRTSLFLLAIFVLVCLAAISLVVVSGRSAAPQKHDDDAEPDR